MNQMTTMSETLPAHDVASLCWALLLACITAACLWIQRAYPRIVPMGRGARVVAHVAIGYFGVGMLTFGLFSVARQSLPVPGGLAWEGSVAVIGGLAACVIGGTTLVEHALRVEALQRPRQQQQPVPIAVETR